jgi:hypothetical protein
VIDVGREVGVAVQVGGIGVDVGGGESVLVGWGVQVLGRVLAGTDVATLSVAEQAENVIKVNKKRDILIIFIYLLQSQLPSGYLNLYY